MSTKRAHEEQITSDGYSRRHDIAYRTGIVLQTLGTAVLAGLYPFENPFYTIGIMLFDLGVLLSALSQPVRLRGVRISVISAASSGLALQAAGAFAIPENYAGIAMLIGIGLVCAGAGGMAGIEAYWYGYREGWFLMLGLPMQALMNLFGKENRSANAFGFAALFLLLLSLTNKKRNQCAKPDINPPHQAG